MEITPVNIAEIDGEGVKLESSFSDGKVLTMSGNKIYFALPNKFLNQTWNLIPTSSGILIKNKDRYVCHFPSSSGDVSFLDESVVEEDIESCYWKIGKNSELYHIPLDTKNEEKYLWIASDNLHVISDGYLAERWMISDGNLKKTDNKIKSYSEPKSNIWMLVVLSIIIIFIICLFLYGQS